jgi:hypothetical protein
MKHATCYSIVACEPEYAAPTELGIFERTVLQTCRAYGAKELTPFHFRRGNTSGLMIPIPLKAVSRYACHRTPRRKRERKWPIVYQENKDLHDWLNRNDSVENGERSRPDWSALRGIALPDWEDLVWAKRQLCLTI